MSDTGFVGPATVCSDELKSAATSVGTMAQYRPYSGGRPASVANATPCGSTTIAPITPASASARSEAESTRGHHLRRGIEDIADAITETVMVSNGVGAPAAWYPPAASLQERPCKLSASRVRR